MNRILKFPQGFLWGSATSSYQVEGGIDRCDWSRDFPAGQASDHYHRYEEDFDLLKSFHHNVYRFSIEWSRIEPEEGKFDEKELEHYRQVVLALRERGIEPFVGFWHYTNPIWIKDKGGWESPQISYYFSRYVKKVVNVLGSEAKFWLTLNEPEIYAFCSYLRGKWPPYKKSPVSFLSVINHLIKAHREAYRVIKEFQPLAQVGLATNNGYYEAYGDPLSILLKNLVEPLDHFYILDRIKDYVEFIGLNYYFHTRIKGFRFDFRVRQNENKEASDLGWEIYPSGIYHVIKKLGRYPKPIYITENGLADAQDKLRKDFIENHLIWVYQAMAEGADVRGYMHWSLLDNFEWDQGFEPRFGLIEIDYKTLERKPRPSANFYAGICKNNQLVIDR